MHEQLESPQTLPTPSRSRIASLDILRGLVIVIMALDHTRDMWSLTTFQPEDMTQTTPIYFFTRWITHFCAPVFVFLAGTSIFLYGQKINSKATLSRFLLIRGFWLIFIEIMLINISWSWTFFWNQWGFFLQVIWVIGICMVIMAVLIWLPKRLLVGGSILLILLHNLLDPITPEALGSWSWSWKLLHEAGWIPVNEDGSRGIFIVYPILPWIGIMGAGYGFGRVMRWAADRRQRFLWRLGLGMIGAFILLRVINVYGNPEPWASQPTALYTFMDFFNTQKYPPSLQFILMTLGPSMLLLIWFEKSRHQIFEWLRIFGRVPFFFYIIHFSVIHLSSMAYFRIVHGQWFDLTNTRFDNWPDFYQPSVLRMYVAWLLIVVGLYFLCRWYNHYKSTHRYWWLKYI